VKFSSLCAASLSVALLGSAAQASELPGLGFDWSGAYFGVNAGFASNASTVGNAVAFEGQRYDDLASRIEDDQTSLMGGGLIGYNLQAGGFVFGAEADLNYLGFSEARSQLRETDTYDVVKGTSFNATWLGTLRGRLGYTLGGLLVYGTAGLAGGDMEAKASVKATDIANGEYAKWKGSTDSMNWGWAAGIGTEYGISNVSFGLEYLFVDLGSASWDANGSGTIPDLIDESNARGSVDYQFGMLRATAKLKL
jgi:outer membrane immunogenic protein